MPLLTRKDGQSVNIGHDITVTVFKDGSGNVRLGIEAPDDVKVLREELDRKPQRPAKVGAFDYCY